MEADAPYSPASIEAEYQKLGHKLGWRFLTCPSRNLREASVCLIGVNPGGAVHEAPAWSVEGGSAYVIESWKHRPPGQENLQRQVQRMFEIMMVQPENVLSGYLVPFRSPSWQALPQRNASLEFGIRCWKSLFELVSPRKVVVFGKDAARHVNFLLGAINGRHYLAGWGSQTIDVYDCCKGAKLIALPHLSRFALFNRPKSEQAFKNALLDA